MFLKKAISALINPLPVSLYLMTAGLVLVWFTRRQRLGKILTTVGVALLILCDVRPVSQTLVLALESQYETLSAEKLLLQPDAKTNPVKWVVVLGAGWAVDPRLPPNLQLHPIALARLVEGLRLYRALPGTKLILSGGKSWGLVPHADVLNRAALQMGVPAQDIVLEDRSHDTEDEAELVQKIIGTDRFVLVTSAVHLPRSVKLFEKRGLKPIPAPADRVVPSGIPVGFGDLIPNTHRLLQTDTAYHEYVGLIWAKLRGAI